MFPIAPPPIRTFNWKDLHGKFLKIGVAQANPEVLEFTTVVYGFDVEAGVTYILAETELNTPTTELERFNNE